MNLTYGNPPDIKDCTDLGTVPTEVVPRKITNEGRFAGQLEMVDTVYGMEIPPLRRVWMTVSYYRNADVPKPYRVKVPGLGTLVYDRDEHGENWSVVK